MLPRSSEAGSSSNNGRIFTVLSNWRNRSVATMANTWNSISGGWSTARNAESVVSSIESLSERQALLVRQDSPSNIIELLFPQISLKRSIVWLSIIQVVVYIITIVYGSQNMSPNDSTLRIFGSTFGPDIKKGEIWRVVTPIFLHGGLFHLVCNVFVILHLGLNLENKYGTPQFLLLYFLSGIWGNLLTVVMSPCVLAVGASTSGFGICGALMAEVGIAWEKLSDRGRKVYGANIALFAALCIYLCFVPSIDMWGHLGGIIVGVAWTVFENPFEIIPLWLKTMALTLVSFMLLILVGFIIKVWFLPMACQSL